MNYLLDTNVLSELRRPRPHPQVKAWMESVPLDDRYISVLTLGELTRGFVLLMDHDKARAEFYSDWMVAVREQYRSRTLPVTGPIAEVWGASEAFARRSLPTSDALMAATARQHGLVMATRNRRHFTDLGITLFDPWTD